MFFRERLKVSGHENGAQLLSFLRKYCPHAPSVKTLKRSIEAKQCRVNGRVETFSTHPLKEGECIEIEWGEKASPRLIRPALVWEDDDLAVYDKPSGVVSSPKGLLGKLVHRFR